MNRLLCIWAICSLGGSYVIANIEDEDSEQQNHVKDSQSLDLNENNSSWLEEKPIIQYYPVYEKVPVIKKVVQHVPVVQRVIRVPVKIKVPVVRTVVERVPVYRRVVTDAPPIRGPLPGGRPGPQGGFQGPPRRDDQQQGEPDQE